MKELLVLAGLGLIIVSLYELFGPVSTLIFGVALIIEALTIKTGKTP